MKLALAGDTMLGRKVAERLEHVPPRALFADDVVAVAREADVFVLNLECAISDRGEHWPNPYKPFFFRAPPVAVEVLHHLGVSCVTLANNHALDYGETALLDTLRRLADAGIATVGAGPDEATAPRPTVLEAAGVRVGVIGVTDHPAEYAATADHAGVAYADLEQNTPKWLIETIAGLETDVVLVSPHWGPNMVDEPVHHVRHAAAAFRSAGATLVAGHSAHVFHGVAEGILYDLGDFIDDYATDPRLRNDLGLLWIVTFENATPTTVEAVPLALDYCFTRLADHDEARWINDRFRRACEALGTPATERNGRLAIEWRRPDHPNHPANGLDLSHHAVATLVSRCLTDVLSVDLVGPGPCALWESDDVLRRVLDGSQRHSPTAATAAAVWVGACHDVCAAAEGARAEPGFQRLEELRRLRRVMFDSGNVLLAALGERQLSDAATPR